MNPCRSCAPAGKSRFVCGSLPRCRSVRSFSCTIGFSPSQYGRSEEHTSELQSHVNLVCRLLLEKKNCAARDYKRALLLVYKHPDAMSWLAYSREVCGSTTLTCVFPARLPTFAPLSSVILVMPRM